MGSASLKQILEATRRSLVALRARARDLEVAARAAAPAPSWPAAFGGSEVSLVAEIKRRSPSVGDIAPDLEPAELAQAYMRAGAHAVSVLTEQVYFGGSLDDLRAVRERVGLPVLRKDFVIDPVQLYESRAAGASAVLLIVRAVERELLRELSALAQEIGLGRLVEVHDVAELDAALELSPETIGVNSRDLDTFAVDVDGMREVIREVPPGIPVVAESGLASRGDVERVAQWGADAVLVGSALAGARDPEALARQLVGVPRRERSRAPVRGRTGR